MEVINYEINKEDFVNAQVMMAKEIQVRAKIKAKIVIFNLVAWVFLGVSFAGLLSVMKSYPFLKSDLMTSIGFLGAALLTMVARFVCVQTVLKNYAANVFSGAVCKQSLEIGHDQLIFKSSSTTRLYNKGAFLFAKDDSKNIYLVTVNGSLEIISKSNLTPEQRSVITADYVC